MANYSRRNSRKSPQRKESTVPWFWMFFGIVLGGGTAILCYGFYTGTFSVDKIRRYVHTQTASPASRKYHSTSPAQVRSEMQSGPRHSEPRIASHSSKTTLQTHTRQEKQQETSPRFEFYTLLPGMEEEVPDHENVRTSNHSDKSHTLAKSNKMNNKASKRQKEKKFFGKPKPKLKAEKRHKEVHKAKVVTISPSVPKPRTLGPKMAQNDTPSQIGSAVTPSVPAANAASSNSAHTRTQQTQKVIANPGTAPAANSSTNSNANSSTTQNANPNVHANANANGPLPSSTTNASTAKTPISGAQYIIQAGVFQDLEAADRLKARLILKGFNTWVQKVQAQNGQTYFRVTLGPYSSERLALNEKKRLKKENKISGTLILQRKMD